MRVVIAGDYPDHPPHVVGGIQAVVYSTLLQLGRLQDLDLHVVTCEKWCRCRRREVHRRWTVHYLPSPARLPHTATMLSVDRWAVRRQIDALAPDLIHAHGQAAAYPFAAFDTGRPTMVTVHGINTLEAQVDPRGGRIKGRLRTAVWGAAERRCLRLATDVVVISPFVQRVIAPHTRARLHIVENPVDDAFFHLEPDPQAGKVLMVGSVQKRKGMLEAIEAMQVVRQRVPHAQLYVAGSFTPAYQAYGDLVQRRVAENGAGEYVHFLGHLGHEALLEAYRTSQIFLFPSSLEASPVALAEAMTAALPAVVADIGGTEHLIEDGVTGYRVPVGDIETLAERIVHLLEDPPACRQFGRRGREIALTRFTAERAANKTYDLYRAMLPAVP